MRATTWSFFFDERMKADFAKALLHLEILRYFFSLISKEKWCSFHFEVMRIKHFIISEKTYYLGFLVSNYHPLVQIKKN